MFNPAQDNAFDRLSEAVEALRQQTSVIWICGAGHRVRRTAIINDGVRAGAI
jgi:hypothetical protein